jgi:hypothetical protein
MILSGLSKVGTLCLHLLCRDVTSERYCKDIELFILTLSLRVLLFQPTNEVSLSLSASDKRRFRSATACEVDDLDVKRCRLGLWLLSGCGW